MNTLLFYLYIYVLGGLTFIPLVGVAIVVVLKHVLPTVPEDPADRQRLEDELEEQNSLKQGNPAGYSQLKAGELQDATGLDAFMTGWLTVTREFYTFPQVNPNEFVSNAQNTETNTEAGTDKNGISSFVKIVKGEEPQNHQPVPIDNKKLRAIRKKNRYFAVLKHGNLFLYKDEQQKNVQQVIVLAHHIVTLWPKQFRDGSLFTKRTAICLLRCNSDDERETIYKSLASDEVDHTILRGAYFLYGDLNVEKEDWYFACLRATTNPVLRTNRREVDSLEPNFFASPLHFRTSDMNELIKTINSSPGQLTTRWLNAIIGRLFLAFQNTERFQEAIKTKVSAKLKKIHKPGFLDDFQITRLNVGHGGPFITFPSLDTLSPDGDLIVKFNMLYTGGLTIEIATKAYLNLSSRFKPREVALNLKVQLKRLEGVMVLKMKKPPSNRLWYAFEKMPQMDLVIEPVVSSRSLNYNLVTNIIENKFREAIRDSVVMPFMDDFVLYETLGEIFRGGIWDPSNRPVFGESKEPTEEPATRQSSEEFTELGTPDLPERDLESPESRPDDPELLADTDTLASGAQAYGDDASSVSSRTRPSAAVLKNIGKRASSVFSKSSQDEMEIPAVGNFDTEPPVLRETSESLSGESDASSLNKATTKYSQNVNASVQKLRGWYTKEKKSFQAFKESRTGLKTAFGDEEQPAERPTYTPPEMIQSRRQMKPKQPPQLPSREPPSENFEPPLDDPDETQLLHFQTHSKQRSTSDTQAVYQKAPDMVVLPPDTLEKMQIQPRNGASMFTRQDMLSSPTSASSPKTRTPSMRSVEQFASPDRKVSPSPVTETFATRPPPPLPSRAVVAEPVHESQQEEEPVKSEPVSESSLTPNKTTAPPVAEATPTPTTTAPPPLPSRTLEASPVVEESLTRAKSGRVRRQHTDTSVESESVDS